MANAAVEAAKKSVFTPAEKDGKLVSVYQTQEYSLEVTTRCLFFKKWILLQKILSRS